MVVVVEEVVGVVAVVDVEEEVDVELLVVQVEQEVVGGELSGRVVV